MPFDYQPHLEGELLNLRPLRADDFDHLYAVASDPLIWEQHPVKERYLPANFRLFFKEALDSGGALVATDKQDGCIIGSSRFYGYDADRDEVEIGWSFLARSYWGGRYNGDMKRQMIVHAFQYVDRVILLVGQNNKRSQRAVEKIGGRTVGSRPDAGGRESIVYEVTAGTYLHR